VAAGRTAEARRRRRQEYSSPLRERQKTLTRDLVTRSVAELIAEGKILTFTTQDVANRAGVSYAAVYRHFPTRKALLEAVNDWVEAVARPKAPPDPTTIDDIPGWIDGVLPILEENAALAQARSMASTVLGLRFRGSARRDRILEELVYDAATNLSEDARRCAFAVIRLLASSTSWVSMRQQFGLDNKQAALAIGWGLRTLIADVKRRNARSLSRRPGTRTGGLR